DGFDRLLSGVPQLLYDNGVRLVFYIRRIAAGVHREARGGAFYGGAQTGRRGDFSGVVGELARKFRKFGSDEGTRHIIQPLQPYPVILGGVWRRDACCGRNIDVVRRLVSADEVV